MDHYHLRFPARTHTRLQNLGASPNSWCFSKTGKKGDGAGFLEYGKPFSSGDVITVTLDLDACTLSFAINGDDQVWYRRGEAACAVRSRDQL